MKSVLHLSVFHRPQEFKWSGLIVPLATAGMIIAVMYLYLYSLGMPPEFSPWGRTWRHNGKVPMSIGPFTFQ